MLADQLEFYQLNFLRIPTDDQGLNRVLNPFAELREVLSGPFGIALPQSDKLDAALERVLTQGAPA